EPATEFVVTTVVTEELNNKVGEAQLLRSCLLTQKEIYVDIALHVTLTSDQRKE
ncbi:hypothetical protein ACJMK2_018759, partial [Sinanodonta woodiana]